MRSKIVYTICVLGIFFLGCFVQLLVIMNIPLKAETRIINNPVITDISLNSAIEKVYDATVVIEGYYRQYVVSTGSGVIYKKTADVAYILTNYHVIEDVSNLQVTLSDGEQMEATVVGTDEHADIAVLSISANKVSQVAELGVSEDLNLGDIVFAIGSPSSSDYQGTVTKGIVSSEERYLMVDRSYYGNVMVNVIQTDASINPGNSGGPLVNVDGKVIGINSLKLVTSEDIEGIGFAIPIDDVKHNLEKLENSEKIIIPNLDFSYTSLTNSKMINLLGLTNNSEITVGVMAISQSKSITDLNAGDILIALNNEEIKSSEHLEYLLTKYEVGTTVSLRYYNGQVIKNIDFKLIK